MIPAKQSKVSQIPSLPKKCDTKRGHTEQQHVSWLHIHFPFTCRRSEKWSVSDFHGDERFLNGSKHVLVFI